MFGIDSILNIGGTIIDKIWPDAEEAGKRKQELALLAVKGEMDGALAELNAKSAIIQAELNQDDKFTKRARPMIIYIGLGIMVINYAFFPILAFFLKGGEIPAPIMMPDGFWTAWGSVVSIYAIGRSVEKKGGTGNSMVDKMVKGITGNK